MKHIANIVSYMMKTSSLLTNFAVVMGKTIQTTADKRSSVKQKTLKFSEDIFERHRSMVSLLKSNEDSSLASMRHLSQFAKKVSEASKDELASQESYVATVASLMVTVSK